MINQGDYTLRKIRGKREFIGLGWTPMAASRPVYITFPGFGVGVTRRSRVVAGRTFYAVWKLNPLQSEDQFIGSYWEVEEFITDPTSGVTAQAVFPMKYAITHFFPSRDVVSFQTEKGTKFSLGYDSMMRVRNCAITIAWNALTRDYPMILDTRVRNVKAPRFELLEDADTPGSALDESSFDEMLASGEIRQPRRGKAAFDRGTATASPDFAGDEDEDEEQTDVAARIGSNMMSCGEQLGLGCYCQFVNLEKLRQAVPMESRMDDSEPQARQVSRRVNAVGKLVSDDSEQAQKVFSGPSHLEGYIDEWEGTFAEARHPYGNQYLASKDLF